jgi:hypothetical protein
MHSMMALMRILPVHLQLGKAVEEVAQLVGVHEAGEVVDLLKVEQLLLLLEEVEVLQKPLNHSSLANLNLLLLREELLLR